MIVGGCVVVGMAALAPASALAASSTVYPAGDTVSFSSQSVLVKTPFGVNATCTLNGGAAAIPAAPGNHNANGPVALSYTTRPTFSSCTPIGSMAVTVATSGTWQLRLQNGTPASAQVAVPVGGVTLTFAGGGVNCSGSNTVAASFNGPWQNGIASPLTASTMQISGGPSVTYTCGLGSFPLLLSAPTFSATDATNPAALVTSVRSARDLAREAAAFLAGPSPAVQEL